MKKTTIQLDKATKVELDKLRMHKREPYTDVIARLLAFYREKGGK